MSITLDENTSWAPYVQNGTGTPPFNFKWTISNSTTGKKFTNYVLGNSNSSYVDNVITFGGIGNFFVTIEVTDQFNSHSWENITIEVHSPLMVSANVIATPSSFDLGNSTNLTSNSTISGGTAPYSYQWYRNGTASTDKLGGTGASGTLSLGANSIKLIQTPTIPGNYTYYFVVKDNAYASATNTTEVKVIVNELLTKSSIGIAPTQTAIQRPVYANLTSGYGTSPFTYTWSVKFSNGSSASGDYSAMGNKIYFSKTGNYMVNVTVKDADGNSAYNQTTIEVYSQNLVQVSISSPVNTIAVDVGQSQAISGTFTSGSGSYEYEWVVQTSPKGSAPSSGYTSGSSPQSFTFSESTSGTYYVFLYVKDTIVLDYQNASIEVIVNNDLVQSAISVSPTSIINGGTVTASVVPQYGTSPFNYTWIVTQVGGGSASGDYTGSGDQVTFTKAGNYTVAVKVSDSFSSATSSNYTIDVSGVVILTASIASSPNPGVTAMDVGHSQVFNSNVEGGSGSYVYAWGISGVSGTVWTSRSYTFNESIPGLYKIYLNVTEGTSKASAFPITVVVNPLPKVTFPVTGSIEIDVGQSVTGSASGGTPTFTYSWVVTMYPSGSSASGLYSTSGDSITFKVAGNYTVELTVKDGDGAIASVTAQFYVNSQLSSSLSLSNPLSSIIDRGNSSLLNVSTSGGSGSYLYQWYEQTAGSSSFVLISGATNATYNFITSSATMSGVYLFYVNVTDAKTDPAYVRSNIMSVTVLSKVIYGVSFSETGLPTGTKWFLNISGGNSYTSSSANLYFLEPNGTYSYSISTGNKSFKPSSQISGIFVVNGTEISQPLVFLPVVYAVTFSEYGLKSGTEWYVNTSNGQSYSTTQSVLTFSEMNDTYHYTLAVVNKQYRPVVYSSSFTVSGGPVSENVNFTLLTYTVIFEQSQSSVLPSGYLWYVNLSNGQAYSSGSQSISVELPNGTYYYTVATADKTFYSPGGTLTVNGQSAVEHVTFSPFYYNVSFIESGLPKGTVWSVSLGNNNNSSSGPKYFKEVNGTYEFIIGGIPGFRTQEYNVTVVVNGSDFKEYVTWTAVTYPITISESGLAAGATWSVTLTTTQGGQEINQTFNSTSSSITFNVTNGTYSYVVTLPNGYKATPAKSTILVAGSAVSTNLKIAALPNYLLLWIVTVALAIVIVVFLLLYIGNKKSLFKREGRFLKIGRTKKKR